MGCEGREEGRRPWERAQEVDARREEWEGNRGVMVRERVPEAMEGQEEEGAS